MQFGDEPRTLNNTDNQARLTNPLSHLLTQHHNSSGLIAYTMMPYIHAIIQSGNLFVYCINNPIMFLDPSGLKIRKKHHRDVMPVTGPAGGGINNSGSGGSVRTAPVPPAAPAKPAAEAGGPVPIGTSFGKQGTLVANNGGQVIDWANLTRHGAQRMAERGITQDMVNSWARNGKALQQSGGQTLYVTRQGAVVINRHGQVVTAYSSRHFDKAMIRIVEQLFGR